LIWNGIKLPQAIDWMSRVVNSSGAWTWNVKRSFYPTKLHEDDIALLKDIYAGVAQTTRVPSASPSDPIPSASPSNPLPCSSSASGAIEDIGGNPTCLLQECQGDCDTDDDCDGNLYCFNRDDDDMPVPGCTGEPSIAYDYCFTCGSNSGVLEDIGGNPACLLQECAGDCDTDDNCDGNLFCFQRDDDGTPVPGCIGTPYDGWDYCISSTTQTPTISPTITTPSVLLSIAPTVWPSGSPTETSTNSPSKFPSTTPSYMPSSFPRTYSPSIKSLHPSSTLSALPSLSPTVFLSGFPTAITTTSQSRIPSITPSAPITPTLTPLALPSILPTLAKTSTPSTKPSQLTSTPSLLVSLTPSGNPTTQAVLPTSNPSIHQSLIPTSTCEEASSDIFLLKIKKDGKPMAKSCHWLNSVPSKRQSKICQQQTGFGEYENPADVCKLTCGAGCAPTNVPSLSPTVTCEDSRFLISFRGSLISCAQVAASGACSNPVASSHCPLTCDACEEYKCEDSSAPWRGNGRDANCDLLASVDPDIVANYCAQSDTLSTTCRGTCEFCSN